jgi:drug/metabolite transporter (DMT)-like permease
MYVYGTAMIKALKWISVAGIVLAIIGVITISLAIRAYPQSNLLGGWGLILGPIYWFGLLLCVVCALAWIVVGLTAVARKLAGKKIDRLDADGK